MTDENSDTLDFGEAAFQDRPELRGHLADTVFRMLAKRSSRVSLVDCTTKRQELTAGKLLAVSTVLSRRWRDGISGKRVGIVFPPGVGGFIANVAVVLAGKVGVSDNISIGDDVIAGGAAKVFTRVPAGRVILGNPAVKMETQLEIQKAMRRLPRFAQQLSKLQETVTRLLEKD